MKYLLLICVNLVTCILYSQTVSEKDVIEFGDVTVQYINKDNIEISFAANLPKKSVKSTHLRLFTPQLCSYNNNEVLNLEPFVVTGYQRMRRDKQALLLNKNRTLPQHYYIAGNLLLYRDTVPFSTWMNDGVTLKLLREDEGCCAVKQLPSLLIAQGYQVKPSRTPVVLFVSEAPSTTTQQKSIYPFLRCWNVDASAQERNIFVRFPVNQVSILDNYSTNKQNLARILESVNLVKSDNRAELRQIDIVGYASPDGNQEANLLLSEKRALALKDYLVQQTNLNGSLINTVAGGEDWDGLYQLVKQSDISFKEQILDIITNTPEAQRNAKLRALAGGRPYQSMVDLLYPQLRDACYINIWYNEVSDPNVQTINKAITALKEGKYQQSFDILQPISYDVRTWNPIGVCYELMGNMSKAVQWYKKAADKGDTQAEQNLERL